MLSRRNDGKSTFSDNTDRIRFISLLGDMSERFGMSIFAYTLMPNHYHLLLQTRRANLSKAMQWFGSTYTRHYNNNNSCRGHLFQGRYKSILAENDAYLGRLSCYIHRNPLRAGAGKAVNSIPLEQPPFWQPPLTGSSRYVRIVPQSGYWSRPF